MPSITDKRPIEEAFDHYFRSSQTSTPPEGMSHCIHVLPWYNATANISRVAIDLLSSIVACTNAVYRARYVAYKKCDPGS